MYRFLTALLVVLPAAYLLLFSLCNNWMLQQAEMQTWLTRAWLIALLVFIYHRWGKKTGNRWESAKTFLLEPQSPYSLAIFRILIFALYFVIIVFLGMNAGKGMAMGYEYFPTESRVAIPWAEWYSLHVPVSPEIVDALAPLFNVSAVFMFLGLFTRVSAIVFVITCFYLLSVHLMFGKVGCSHHLLWFPAILAFSDCSKALSLDALIRKYILKKPADDAPSWKYGFPLKASILLLGVIYFFPGFWKLWNGGFDWIFRCNITDQMYYKWASLNYWTPVFRLDHYPLLVMLSGIFVIAFELGFIFLVVKPAWRWWLLLAGTAMHTGIYILMDISFFTLLPVYAVLIDWDKLLTRFKIIKPFPPPAIPQFSTALKDLRGVLVIAIILLSGNIVLGIAKVLSYPFTCYPPFDSRLSPDMDRIYYEGYADGTIPMTNEQIKERIFKRRFSYNLSEVEGRMITAYYANDSVQIENNIRQVFSFPEDFADMDSILVYKIKHPMKPELKDEIKEKISIGTFYPTQ